MYISEYKSYRTRKLFAIRDRDGITVLSLIYFLTYLNYSCCFVDFLIFKSKLRTNMQKKCLYFLVCLSLLNVRKSNRTQLKSIFIRIHYFYKIYE